MYDAKYIKKIENIIKEILSGLNGEGERIIEHCQRVGENSADINRDYDAFSDYTTAYCAGFLHDIGKIMVPEGILVEKPALSKEEYNIIKKHPEDGVRKLKEIEKEHHIYFNNEIFDAVLYHHKNYDGSGYPENGATEGIKGKEIPLLGRIVHLADYYDAMIHRKAKGSIVKFILSLPEKITKKEQIKMLEKEKGILFDPYLVDIFVDILKKPISTFLDTIDYKYNGDNRNYYANGDY